MPTIKPNEKSGGFVPMGTTVSDAERLEMAGQVFSSLERFKPGEFPERPELLTYDDGQIVEAYKARSRGEKISKAATEQLRYFGAWRAAVWRAEGESTGKLVVLAAAVRCLESAPEGESSDKGRLLRGFIREWYRCSLPAPVPDNDRWVGRWANRFGQNRRLLPLWLRVMSTPPVGHSTRASGEFDDDEDPRETQRRMDFGPDPETGEWAE